MFAEAKHLGYNPVILTSRLTGEAREIAKFYAALAMLAEIAKRPDAYSGITFASVATDGNDGPTDAAGAFASAEMAERAEEDKLSINEYLADNDAYTFFSKIARLIKTGPQTPTSAIYR